MLLMVYKQIELILLRGAVARPGNARFAAPMKSNSRLCKACGLSMAEEVY